MLTALPLPQGNGRIVVDKRQRFPAGQEFGRLATARRSSNPRKIAPPTAQHALRQPKTCAENIVASYRRPDKAFRFTGLGRLDPLVGARQSPKFWAFVFRLPAWLLWRVIYVSKFPGLDGQLRLIADWVSTSSCRATSRSFGSFTKKPVHREHFEPGETVFANGDFGDKVYFIIKGEAAVERDAARGHVAIRARHAGHCGKARGQHAAKRQSPHNSARRPYWPDLWSLHLSAPQTGQSFSSRFVHSSTSPVFPGLLPEPRSGVML